MLPWTKTTFKVSNKQLILFLVSKWKLFAGVGIIAVALSAGLSHPAIIHPKYESTAIFYPSNLVNFSEESPTEQMLQVMESNDLKDSIIEIFNLAQVYDIDSAPGYRTLVTRELGEHFSIGKTEYESVEIKVRDESPDQAKAMVSEFIRLANNHVRGIQRKKDYEYLLLSKQEMDRKLSQLDSIQHELKRLRIQTGLIEYGQAEVITEQYLEMLRKGETGQRLQIAKDLYQSLKEQGGALSVLTRKFEYALDEYGKIRGRYEAALTNVNKNLTYTNMVMEPTLPDKKVYPVRWLIVALTVMSAMLLTAIVLVMSNEPEDNSPIA